MAHSNERIEFLRESRQLYKQEAPPFTQRGNVGYKKEVMILPPYVDKPRKTTVVYVRYKLNGGDRTFACLRMNRRRYIVKAMKRNWQVNDPIDNTGGSCYWYRWEGPNAARQFIGPIAMSMTRYLANNPGAKKGIQPWDEEDAGSQRYQDSRPDSTRLEFNPNQGVVEQDSESAFLSSASSSEISSGRHLAQQGMHTDEHSPALDLPQAIGKGPKSRVKIEPRRKGVSTTTPQKRSARVLSPAQEQSTILHIKLLEDGVTPVKIKLSSAAVPEHDSEKRVTHESFFGLVTRIVNPISQPHLIQAAIYRPLSQVDNKEASDHQANIQYEISISYQAEETFDGFLDKIKAYFEEHHSKNGGSKSYECHVAIKSTVIVPRERVQLTAV